MRRVLAAAALALSLALPGRAAETVRLHAAGSLKPAMNEIAAAFTAAYGIAVRAEFGASGLLRERLEEGEAGDVFASADMGNPLALMRAGEAGPVVLFARNRLCAIVRPGLAVTPATLLATMLDPAIKLGTSTPKADPSGDYAWAIFGKAETGGPGQPRGVGSKGADAHRRAAIAAAARWAECLCVASRRGPRRSLPRLLHDRRAPSCLA